MLKHDRHEQIMRTLNERGSLLVSDACALFGCSDQTIRRDFMELEETGQIRRVHGGAYLYTENDRGVPANLRALMIQKEKTRIAEIAAGYVEDDDILMLDSSTTCATFARHLMATGATATIITNSYNILRAFESAPPSIQLICIGGRYRERSASFMGRETTETIAGYLADKAFISCNALNMEFGMMDTYERQLEVRLAMLAHAKKKYLLADHTKFVDNAEYIIGDLSVVDAIITDSEPSSEWQAYLKEKGIPVYW